MDRRSFIKGAVAGSIAAGFATTASATSYFPQQVEPSLFDSINRVKDPGHKTSLEMSHVPMFTVPAVIKAGTMFTVEVTVGEKLHSMSPTHWIQDIELYIGNDPAGNVELQPKGYLSPKVQFNVTLPASAAPAGKVTLVAAHHCNLHGYWESRHDIQVV